MKPEYVSINGIDISQYVTDVTVSEVSQVNDDVNALPGLKSMGPITITFDTRPLCGVCGERFVDGPEGIPHLTCTATGFRVPACPACVIALASNL